MRFTKSKSQAHPKRNTDVGGSKRYLLLFLINNKTLLMNKKTPVYQEYNQIKLAKRKNPETDAKTQETKPITDTHSNKVLKNNSFITDTHPKRCLF